MAFIDNTKQTDWKKLMLVSVVAAIVGVGLLLWATKYSNTLFGRDVAVLQEKQESFVFNEV